jgi:hypothetical protein
MYLNRFIDVIIQSYGLAVQPAYPKTCINWIIIYRRGGRGRFYVASG